MATRARTAESGRLARLLLGALTVLLVGGTLLVALHYWLGVGDGLHDVIGTWIYDAVVLGAGVACLSRASAYGRERNAWVLLGLAILVWGAGEVYWSVAIEDNPSAPYPSPADIGYLAFYPSHTRGSSCWFAPAPTRSTGASGWTD